MKVNIIKYKLLFITSIFLVGCGSKRGVIPDNFALVSAFHDDDRIRQEIAYLIVKRARIMRSIKDIIIRDTPADDKKDMGKCTNLGNGKVNLLAAMSVDENSIEKYSEVVQNTATKGNVNSNFLLDSSNSQAIARCADANTLARSTGDLVGLKASIIAEYHVQENYFTSNLITKVQNKGIYDTISSWNINCIIAAFTSTSLDFSCSDSTSLKEWRSGDSVSAQEIETLYTSPIDSDYKFNWVDTEEAGSLVISDTITKSQSARLGVSLSLRLIDLKFPSLESCIPLSGAVQGVVSDTNSGAERKVSVSFKDSGQKDYSNNAIVSMLIGFDAEEALEFQEMIKADNDYCYSL